MVSFELGKEINEDGFRLLKSVGPRKIQIPMRNQTSDLRIPRSDALPSFIGQISIFSSKSYNVFISIYALFLAFSKIFQLSALRFHTQPKLLIAYNY